MSCCCGKTKRNCRPILRRYASGGDYLETRAEPSSQRLSFPADRALGQELTFGVVVGKPLWIG